MRARLYLRGHDTLLFRRLFQPRARRFDWERLISFPGDRARLRARRSECRIREEVFSSINFTPMRNLNDQHLCFAIPNVIDDSIVAHPNTIKISFAFHFDNFSWTWVSGQRVDTRLDSLLNENG